MGGGRVKAQSVVATDVGERFDAFVTALCERRIVPLLGAGVSVDVVDAAQDLAEKLKKCDLISGSDENKTFDFARLAEICSWGKGGLAQVLEELEIAKWADVSPSRAHRYLALLACEGLITDIVTTNWDCGLEAAWRQARGRSAEGWKAITEARELRRPRAPGDRGNLNLYKINGCAQKWRDAECKETAAQDIQLTELQLQQFGKRRWAGDLVRVLLRERQIVLSGFGSEEPQVWHVVMDILREFEEWGRGGRSSTAPSPAHRSHNGERALWVAEYEETIGFRPQQALVGENRAFGRDLLKFDNVFSGGDAAFFGADGGKLDAGDFWRAVWREAIHRRLGDPEGPAVATFVGHVSGRRYRAARHLDRRLRDLWKQVVDQAFVSGVAGRARCCHFPGTECCRWLEEPDTWPRRREGKPERDAPVAPYLACLPETGYLSVQDEPEYWVVLLLLLLLCSDECPSPTEGSPRACLLEAAVEDHEPVVKLVRGAAIIVVALPTGPARSGVALRRGDGGETSVALKAYAPPWPALEPGNYDLETLRNRLRSFVEKDALHEARRLESQRRGQRRQPMAEGSHER